MAAANPGCCAPGPLLHPTDTCADASVPCRALPTARPHTAVQKFLTAFSAHGEPNIAVDEQFMASAEFAALLGRLHASSALAYKDCWAQCGACRKWRVVSAEAMRAAEALAAEGRDWTCAAIGARTSCETPQTWQEAYHNAEPYSRSRPVVAAAAAAEPSAPPRRPRGPDDTTDAEAAAVRRLPPTRRRAGRGREPDDALPSGNGQDAADPLDCDSLAWTRGKRQCRAPERLIGR